MDNRTILIIDTNFVIGMKSDFSSIVKRLQEKVIVYLPQLVLQERLSHKWRELKDKFDEIEKVRDRHSDLVVSLSIKSFDAIWKKQETFSTKSYEELFGKDKIIPIDDASFKQVLDRACKRLPLFLSDKNDKGFKDSVLWLSIIKFFRIHKTESDIVLLTNDNGFEICKTDLIKEFKSETSCKIDIQKTEYYKTFLEETKPVPIEIEKNASAKKEINVELLRERIGSAFDAFVGFHDDDNGEWVERFVISEPINKSQAQNVIENMNAKITEHLFSTNLSAEEIFGERYKIKGKYYIRIKTIEEIIEIKKHLDTNFKEGLDPFYLEFANHVNSCVGQVIDDDLPF